MKIVLSFPLQTRYRHTHCSIFGSAARSLPAFSSPVLSRSAAPGGGGGAAEGGSARDAMDLLITNVDANTLLPSFFEMAMQKSIQGSIAPAIEHLTGDGAAAFVAKACIDLSSLVSSGALLSERICGFERMVLGREARGGETPGGAHLRGKPLSVLRGGGRAAHRRRVALALALWVLLPEIWKLAARRLRRRADALRRQRRPRLALALDVLGGLPASVVHLLELFLQVAYLVGASPFFSLPGILTRQVLVRGQKVPRDGAAQKGAAWSRFRTIVILSLVAFKALEWTYRERETLGAGSGRPLSQAPAPPEAPLPAAEGCGVPVSKELCCLCSRPRVNAATTGSGYLCCYGCLLPFVRENGCCPVTREPARAEDVIRVYEGGEEG